MNDICATRGDIQRGDIQIGDIVWIKDKWALNDEWTKARIRHINRNRVIVTFGGIDNWYCDFETKDDEIRSDSDRIFSNDCDDGGEFMRKSVNSGISEFYPISK